MNKINTCGLLLTLICLFGCSSSAQFASSAGYMKDREYQRRDELKYSLFGNNPQTISEQDIQKVLNSKIILSKKIRLGVIKLESNSTYTSNQWYMGSPLTLMNNKAFILNEELKNQFFGTLKKSGRIRDITLLPSMMIPAPMTVPALRESAVRMQVDLLLVLRSENLADYEFMPFWIKDTAKTVSTVEAILLDSGTGAIPFTSIATDSAVLKEKSSDLNRFELIKKSSEEAETKALITIANNLSKFIQEAP